MKAFKTSFGNLVPARAIAKAVDRLERGEDWQKVATEEIREFIPDHDEDLAEADEVLCFCESIIDDAETEED